MTTKTLFFASRPSALARWQTDYVISRLEQAWPQLVCKTEIITTKGDRVLDKPLPEIGGKGLFTQELEEALRMQRVDAAVHSLKDLPTETDPDLTIGAILQRADPHDVWICPSGHTLENLPPGSIVGTSSNRRRAQLLAKRPDLNVQPIRGNVDTRLQKVQAGQYNALVLAAAGVERLGLDEFINAYLPFEIMLPAPGQGALAVQCRSADQATQDLLRAVDHLPTRQAVRAERAFLAALGSGCSLPVGAYAQLEGDRITLEGIVASPDGSWKIALKTTGKDPEQLGDSLAQQAFAQGAAEILAEVK